MTGFVKAERKKAKLRLALIGPSGAGKTMTALKIAQGLGNKIAVIDTEHGSASKYAGEVADFDVMELTNYHPDNFIAGLKAAAEAGYEVVIIDSLSHAWMGEGGVLEQVDAIAARSRTNNSFAAWRDGTKLQTKLVDAILSSPCHVISTMRAKTEYVLENVNGRTMPKKMGMGAVQRENSEYDYDIVMDLDLEHRASVSKSRMSALQGALIDRPGKEVGQEIAAWLGSGVEDAQLVKAKALTNDLINKLGERADPIVAQHPTWSQDVASARALYRVLKAEAERMQPAPAPEMDGDGLDLSGV